MVDCSCRSKNDGLRVMCVGLACMDSVFLVRSYPVEEDIKERAIHHRWHRGGNASNSSTILALLGARTEYLGTLSSTTVGRFLVETFNDRGIIIDNCVYYDEFNCPVATVIINQMNGSRTIIHNDSNLPELSAEDFNKLDLSKYSWIHFEGRNVGNVVQMVAEVRRWNNRQPPPGTTTEASRVYVSVELERPRDWLDEIQEVARNADLVFVSKDFADFMGWKDVHETLEGVVGISCPGVAVIATWGTDGAMARSPDGKIFTSPIFPPKEVVDTLAAGDTFVGAAIYSLNTGHTLQEAIIFGCQIAGIKVGMHGVDGVVELHRELFGK